MGSFKQQWLTWIIVSAVCVSCQEQGITSTLREGNYTCPGEEVAFTCTLRGSIALAWISPGYIADGNPLQFSAGSTLEVDVPSMINGRITATATLTRNVIDNGEQVLVSTLRITATVASTVTCSGSTGGTESIEFSISDIPEAPLNVGAIAVSQLFEIECVLLVKWDPLANSVDITHYLIYIPALNMNITTNSLMTSLPLRDCPESFGITVAAVNRFGCVGINSSEVNVTLQPTSKSNQLAIGTGAIAEITLAVVLVMLIGI